MKAPRINVNSGRDNKPRSRACQLELVGHRLIRLELDLGDETPVLPPGRADDLPLRRKARVCLSVRDESYVTAVVVGKADLGIVLRDPHASWSFQLVDDGAPYLVGFSLLPRATGTVWPAATAGYTADPCSSSEATPSEPTAAPPIAAVMPLLTDVARYGGTRVITQVVVQAPDASEINVVRLLAAGQGQA